MSELTFMEILVRIPIVILWLSSIISLKLFIVKFIFIFFPEYLIRQMKNNNSLTKPED